MILKLTVVITDPQTGQAQLVVKQFDSATVTQAKWTALFPEVQAAANAVVASSGPTAPPLI